MYEKIFQSTKLVQPKISSDVWKHLYYLKTWDAFLAASNFEYARVFRDGTKVSFGSPSGQLTLLGRVKGFPAYWSSWTRKIYPAFEINGLVNPNEALNPEWDIDTGIAPLSGRGAFIDDLAQVYLYQSTSNKITVYSLEDGSEVGEIIHNAGEHFASLTWVEQGQVAGLCKTSGKVRIMNYLGASPGGVETGRIDPFRVAAYDPTFHNFFAIGTDHQTRVYCREAWPAALSNPVFDPATVYGLKANRVRTQLTGQDGEPCPDWWVHWELVDTGGGIIGYLDKTVTKTGEDGWAENLYYGPDDNLPGECKIQCRVVLS